MIFRIQFVVFLLLPMLISADSDDPMNPGADYDGSKISFANMTVAYGARAYGFFSIFDRRQPYVLFHTVNGVQMLSDNGTCYPNFPIMPYAVIEEEVRYMEASPQDNYIILITVLRTLCTKNLIHSEWNNGIAFDFKDECRDATVGNFIHFSLSVSRHVIYALDKNGVLSVISIREPGCTFTISESRNEYAEENVKHLHVTNYHGDDNTDSIMISLNNSNQVHVLSMTGRHQNTHNMTEGDQVLAVKSNALMNIFIAVDRSSTLVVSMYSKSLKNKPVEFFSYPNSQMVSLSASNRVVAILMRDKEHSNVSESTNFTLVIRPIDGKKSKNNETWYHCENANDLKGMTIVDNSEPSTTKYFCDENKNICDRTPTIDACDPPTDVLQFKILSPLVDPKSVDREGTTKLYMMVTLSILTLLSVIYLQFITPLS